MLCPRRQETFQGQTGWGSEHPDVALGVPVHCRGVGLDGLQGSLPTQKKNSMTIPPPRLSLGASAGEENLCFLATLCCQCIATVLGAVLPAVPWAPWDLTHVLTPS